MNGVVRSEAILAGVVSDLALLPGKLRTGAAVAQEITVTVDAGTALRMARAVEAAHGPREVLVREIEPPMSRVGVLFWSLMLATQVYVLLQPAAAALAAWVLA